MNGLVHRDLNQLSLDVDTWLGRAALAGVENERLPDSFTAALMAFLRIHSLSFAQQQRTGIALGKDKLRRGVEMGLACIDWALEEQSAGDLNKAVDVLAAGDFAKLYKSGWELAFARMEDLRARAVLLHQRRHLAFFASYRDRIGALAHLVPETWTSADAEGELVEVDLRADGDMLAAVEGRVEFLRALPDEAFAALWAGRGIDFAQVLRRIVLALALARHDLSVDAEVVRAFESTCIADGLLLPAVKEAVWQQVAVQLREQGVELEVARQIERETKEEVAAVEKAAAGGSLLDLFVGTQTSEEHEFEHTEAARDEELPMEWREDD